ncbi:formate dehydrogenase subunit gamma [Ramlibacter tataouinensis]|uniref:Candidate formate dehydrogenase subunit C n=1 Tax=Ramlibacter tataouinensis (strain ATCC BAA-407 / DSM 14655 / LMG 21543 / TTB310) TaxID=365046 RepID=F5XWL4_RAMTT|nr:formate dehydrogenase subunit gamma [Ramlibacter tataouinensis]AEG94158.1 candidate formate dehydrogenase subunit C precursor [Ramlibacter tataouinensis TTB310]
MPRSTEAAARLSRTLAVAAFVALGLVAGASAQNRAQDDPPPPPAQGAGQGGIQGQNIFDVKPEVKPDASSLPGYMEQNNAQRNRVQPGNNSPMWRGVQAGAEGYTSLPRSQAPEAGILIQEQVQYPGSRLTTAGEAWRQVRNNWILPYGGALLLIVLGAIAIFYFSKGAIETHGHTGRRIERFTPFERSAHWANAIAFVALAVSGIVMAFGKFFLLPIMGGTLFGWLTYALKNIHNFAGPLFAVSLAIVFFTFLRDNWPQRGDLKWLLKGGGLFGKAGHEPPSHRFNAGEKVVFWGGVFFLGIIVVASGLVLDKLIPNLVYERGTMQIAHMVHAVATVLMMCMFLGHIYLGTIGMRGAYSAMRTGYVDEAWAKEHHAYWYEDVQAGKIPAQRSKPAGLGADAVRTA